MNVVAAETVVLEKLIPDLQSQGYDVFVHPIRKMIPDFLGSYQPDVIALREDKNLVYEIKSQSKKTEALLQNLTKRFEGQSQWEFRVIWVNSVERIENPAFQSLEKISERIDEISEMLAAGFFDSAMLMCWATFEAIGRRLTSEFSRPQTPGRLVQVLAKEGHITPDEADFLRSSAERRNRLIHGELTTRVSRIDVEMFLKLLQLLLGTVPSLDPAA